MSTAQTAIVPDTERLDRLRTLAEAGLQRARRLFEGGATGIQTAAAICEGRDLLVLAAMDEALSGLSSDQLQRLKRDAAMIAIGGTGRGELAPFSDIDLLFLHRDATGSLFQPIVAQVVRDCWDVRVQVGHSLRSLGEALTAVRSDPHFATALVDARLLWGSEALFAELLRRFRRQVSGRRARGIAETWVAARDEERRHYGESFRSLVADVKRAPGGLRDYHLLRWIGFALYGTADIDRLRLLGALQRDDARHLLAAYEFLTRVRIDMHFAAGKAQDVLSQEEQLRLAESWGIRGTGGQRPVERFMQTYFRHSRAVEETARRFVRRHAPLPMRTRLVDFLLAHRVDRQFVVSPRTIDIRPRERELLGRSLEGILRLYRAAARNGVEPTPELTDWIKRIVPTLPPLVSDEARSLFLSILAGPGRVGATLRHMHETGLLERILPEWAHVRCLLQFNQYHRYTVDEHTLRAVEAAERFATDEGSLGEAFRSIRHKEILYLAILLHDIGKGFEEDHCDVGRRIALRTAARLRLPVHHRDLLAFLVQQHLLMAHLALRRDIAADELIVGLSRQVGTPEVLSMLYVLTAADLTAVGPGVWTAWKADLVGQLYRRVMSIVSGRECMLGVEDRAERIRDEVCALLSSETDRWDVRRLRDRLASFPPHYLLGTPVERIAADVDLLDRLDEGVPVVEGSSALQPGVLEFRIVADASLAEGCFHKICGALTAAHLEILSALICTTDEGTVIDSFRVVDHDAAHADSASRIEQIRGIIVRVLTGQERVETLFRRHRRFDSRHHSEPISDLPTRVVADHESSQNATILDVFAHDRPGLLYTVARAIYKLGLSVVLAKIGTHSDQVVDVFYVTDANGRKIDDAERLETICRTLQQEIELFEREGARTLLGR